MTLMESAIQPERMRIAPPAGKGGAVRQACAAFWLNVMFYLSRRAPGFVRFVRPFIVRGTFAVSRSVRDATLANAGRLLGENATLVQRRELGKRIVGSFYDVICDMGWTRRMSRPQLVARIAAIEGKEQYSRVRQEGKGAIIASAHMGSFELGMAGMLEVEKRIHLVFQRDASSLFEKLRREFHQRMGIIEAAVDDGWGMWMKLREALAADEIVVMHADRAMPGQIGVRVPFMGGHMLFPEGPAKLAAIAGAPIIPVFCVREEDGRVRLFIEQAIRVNEPSAEAIAKAMAELAEVAGRYVRKYPDQWLVLQRAWCEDMTQEQTAAASS